ncbi:hypothetical protein AQS8620_00497 [Aquimixticola soesokkakensis]|uniref:Non-haem dioxygenase N-terminal domain-containing protein n=2 Tax=Aquimixticola soesokkakensis TaxID=1519096 RepID=A0A1Y5RL27_9RHOB|nr:hypothetical protein AQS8620_00497 [Aquimixticola soesokkakensis]
MPASLPMIDISDLVSSDTDKRAKVGAQMREACLAHGFFYVTGHGVPHGLMTAVMEQTRALFDLPVAAKTALDKANSPCNRGYEVLGGQSLDPRQGPASPPITVEQHLRAMYARTYAAKA